MVKKSQAKIDRQKVWEDKIFRAKSVRENWKRLFKVDVGRVYFDGVQNPGYPDAEWVTINKIYSHLKATLPTLYAADPYFYVKVAKSYSPDPMMIAMFEKRGKIRQSMLNYIKKEIDLKPKVRLNIQDAHFAYGVAKIHHHANLVENQDKGKPMKGDGDVDLLDDSGEPILEPEYIPVNERYCLTRIHPDDFLWDEDAGPLEDEWAWVAQKIDTTYKKIKKDGRYDKKAVKALEGKAPEKGQEEQDRETRKKGDIKGKSESKSTEILQKDEDKPVVLWEIYDLEEGKWSVIAEDGETPLVDEKELPKGIEKHPFSILRFTIRDDSPYPHPPVSPMLKLQDEKNLLRSRMVTHRKRFNRKYEVLTQVDDTEAAKLESGEDGTFIKVPQLGCINPIKDAPLDQQTTIVENSMIDKDLIEVGGGTSDEARGIAGADSATQAGIIDKRLEVKEGDAMSMVVDFTTTIARKLDQLVQANITKDEAVRVSGPQGEFWELVKSDDYEAIDGEFEYSVNVGATIPQLPQMERQSWQAFLTLLSTFPHLLTQKHLLKRMAEMHHIEDEAMLEELYQLGKQIMGGQVPMPGAGGSQKGQGEVRPVSAMGGMAGGMQSMAGSQGAR